MTREERWIVLVLVSFTLWLHWLVAWQDSVDSLQSAAAEGFVAAALSTSATVLFDVVSQVGVIVLLYALFLYLIVWLGRYRPEGEAVAWWRRAAPLLITWFSAFWLLLHLHATLFPNSVWGYVPDPEGGGIAMFALDGLSGGWLVWRLCMIVLTGRHRGGLFLLAATVAVVATGSFVATRPPVPLFSAPAGRPPDVVIIGLDSLRRDLVLGANATTLPNVVGIRDQAWLQTGVISSLARTYPSWTSLLTGRPVADSQVRDNHAPASHDAADSFAWRFREAGYQTVFATDDTQFSDIGHAEGFETVVSPESGVANFFLSRVGDLPLVNFVVQLPGMETFLPSLVGNRAFYQAYRPERFVQRLRDGWHRDPRRPVLLAIHLCALHWPFRFAAGEDGIGYSSSVQVLDRQVGEILALLPSRGIDPDRRLLILLADHGDSGDDLFRKKRVSLHGVEDPGLATGGGHGGTLFDPLQWRTFALFQGRGMAGPIAPGQSRQLASLADLRASILSLAGLPEPSRPLLDVAFASRPRTPRVDHATISLETGLRTADLNLANPDTKVAARLASTLYRIRPDGGTELTAEAYAESVATKDLGVTDDHQLLVSVWRPRGNLLISEDLENAVFDVYPGERPPGPMKAPPLLEAACRGPEFRARHASWCTERAAAP